MKFSALPAIAGASLFMFAFSTHAALVQVDIDLSNPGLEGVYDDVLDITWLADANLAGVTLDWNAAEAFIDNLNTTSYLGVTSWRQAAAGSCTGFNCGDAPVDTDDELGYHHYQNFGASAFGAMTSGSNTTNLAMFSNIQNSVYWTGTELDSSSAFIFDASFGLQVAVDKSNFYYVWAVAPGNVAANAVPVPGAVWLFGSALMGLAGLARRR